MSYQTDAQAAYFSGKSYNRTRYCIDKRGEFATGLFRRVRLFLLKNRVEYDTKDTRVIPTKTVDHKSNFKIYPYPAQILAADTAARLRRTIISMPTGSGKSMVMAIIAARLQVRTLIVVPSLEIRNQLLMTFRGIFKDMSNITIENIDSRALKTSKNYDLLIIDEAHHVAAKTYRDLNAKTWTGIYNRVFMTATPFRNNTEETLLFEGIAGHVGYQLSYQDAVTAGYIVPIEAYCIEVPKVKTDAYTYAEVYSELVTNNIVKNNLIGNTLLTLQYAEKATLCLVKEIKHGEALAKLTGVPFVNGQDESSRIFIEQFNKGEIKALIGTTGVLAEGVDTKPAEYVMICGSGKAKSSFMQAVGRVLRTFPGKESGKVILIRDKSHKFLLRHYNEQVKILKSEYNVVVTKLGV